jgi:hypothetical protein
VGLVRSSLSVRLGARTAGDGAGAESWGVSASWKTEGRQAVELRVWREEKKNLESLEEERVSMSKVGIYPVSINNAYLGLWFQFRFIFV